MQGESGRDGIAAGRLGIVGAVLSEVLVELGALETPEADSVGGGRSDVAVLDCGGGSGTFAVPLAAEGAHVTVVDISADALATLRRRADEAGVAERVTPVAGDVEALSAAIGERTFDLALAHGILEAVDTPGLAFGAIAAAVRPGGLISILVGNPVAGVLARALAGDLGAARRELADVERAVGPQLVHELCDRHGLVIERVHGVGVFADLVPGAALDAPGARNALAELEADCATRSPFADIAGRVHVLARRPG